VSPDTGPYTVNPPLLSIRVSGIVSPSVHATDIFSVSGVISTSVHDVGISSLQIETTYL
jgi:hypothetical protein